MSDADSLERAYRESLLRHGYTADAAQERAVARLDDLKQRIELAAAAGPGWRGRWLRLRGTRPAAERGLYLWGGVGRGKTFLMDLFHARVGVPARREHFHRFMKEVHARLRQRRELEDPLALVAGDLAGGIRLLCLDEFFVSDIADAMLLSGLISGLLDHGVTLVFTSNVPPSELYRDGLQRSRFLPAIALIERWTESVNVDGGLDYRLRQLERAPLYFDAQDGGTAGILGSRFEAIAGDRGDRGGMLEIEGRRIPVLRRSADVVWFDFTALCTGPRSASDYVEIARDFHTVVLSGVPVFEPGDNDAARRFISLVDEFYDRNVKLVISADAAPEALYHGERLDFEFERTRSRLAEMQTHEYLARPHRP
jgi:cell division protein ZapE